MSVADQGKSKPIIRKGFFDTPNQLAEGETELYPDGSAEGIMAPGTGEAINFIPEGVKSKCHVVDPGAMDQVGSPSRGLVIHGC